MGYSQAGCTVWGVDIDPQPHYPFTFLQTDAIELLQRDMGWVRDNFNMIHASPPCQHYSVLRAIHKDIDYPDLVGVVRALLDQSHLPYIIENVAGAPLNYPIMLCGTMFGKKLFRHRYFEIGRSGHKINIPILEHVSHVKQGLKAPKTSRAPDYSKGEVHSVYGHFSGVEAAREEMGIDWMNRDEMAQAIPPYYTRYIAEQLLYKG